MTKRPHVKPITLYTDAGFREGMRPVWAIAAFRGDATLFRSGRFRAPCSSSAVAELAAVGNGLALALKAFEPPAGTLITIRVDCIHAVSVAYARGRIGRVSSPAGRESAAIVPLIWAMVQATGVVLRFRYVKAHAGADTECGHQRINRMCDMECSRLLRADLRASRATTPAAEACPPC